MRSLLAALLLAGCTPAPPLADRSGLQTWPEGVDVPADVEAFIVQWEACAHWLGEPPWDEARRRQIEHAVRDTCRGVDARGRRVRARYANDPQMLERLRDYAPLGQ